MTIAGRAGRRLAVGALLVLLAVGLGALVRTGALAAFDGAVLRALSIAGDDPRLVAAVQAFARAGRADARAMAIVGILAAFVGLRRWRAAVVYVGVVATAITGHVFAKAAFARARPHLVPWLDAPQDMSFPSGHAAGATVVLLLAALLDGRRGAIVAAAVLALLMGLTRPMLGVHWPTDVIGGWLWGAGFALIGSGLWEGWAARQPGARVVRVG